MNQLLLPVSYIDFSIIFIILYVYFTWILKRWSNFYCILFLNAQVYKFTDWIYNKYVNVQNPERTAEN